MTEVLADPRLYLNEAKLTKRLSGYLYLQSVECKQCLVLDATLQIDICLATTRGI